MKRMSLSIVFIFLIANLFVFSASGADREWKRGKVTKITSTTIDIDRKEYRLIKVVRVARRIKNNDIISEEPATLHDVHRLDNIFAYIEHIYVMKIFILDYFD